MVVTSRAVALGPEGGPLFATYRAVPWLARTHAVTVLPSVSSLVTLRALPAADPRRRPFVGFGDPYFSQEQARRAALDGTSTPVVASRRGFAMSVRSSPRTQSPDSSRLAMLPRLPDTAEEVRSLARATGADMTRDVFLAEQVNKRTVKTLNLADYRVLAFATHGLVPGDLDGHPIFWAPFALVGDGGGGAPAK